MKGEHMLTKGQFIPVIGLLATIGAAGYMVTRVSAQNAPAPVDLRQAATAELRDAQDRVVLAGAFMVNDEDDDDIERKAALKANGTPADAAGVAEVEFARQAALEQEVEFAGTRLAAGTTYRLMIDGREVLSGVAKRDGDLELEATVPIPGARP
jgi:hypothetical protein